MSVTWVVEVVWKKKKKKLLLVGSIITTIGPCTTLPAFTPCLPPPPFYPRSGAAPEIISTVVAFYPLN